MKSGLVKGCPFCGKEAQFDRSYHLPSSLYSIYHKCEDTGMIIKTEWKDSRKEAADDWNRRVADKVTEVYVEDKSCIRTGYSGGSNTFIDDKEESLVYFQSKSNDLAYPDGLNILLVGGTWGDANDVKESGIVRKMFERMTNIISVKNVDCYNGGEYSVLKDVLSGIKNKGYDVVFWFANVDNKFEKVRNVKEIEPKVLLVTSKRNDPINGESKYSLEDMVQRALAIKANLFFEFVKGGEKGFVFNVFDPLGNRWYSGDDINEAVNSTIERLNSLRNVTRIPSDHIDGDYTLELFRDEDVVFLEIVREHASEFHSIMGLPSNVKRFVGNASLRFENETRCMNGFPAIRSSQVIDGITAPLFLMSRRNVDKTGITEKDFVPVYMGGDGHTKYLGDNKPSVDTPIQLRLFAWLKNIDYILHGHVYIEGEEAMTHDAVPCGAVEEVDQILNAIDNFYGTREGEFYMINLKGHGCLIMASRDRVEDLRYVSFHARPFPEVM